MTEDGRKTTGTDPAVLPRVVVYDPELTASLPRTWRSPAGSTRWPTRWRRCGRPGATRPAPPSPARRSPGWPPACAPAIRPSCSAGLWLGASAFAVAGSGLHHKLCHVLGGTFDLPHARTHAVVLPHVLAFNAPGAPDAVARVARALGTDDAVSGLRALADEHGIPRGLRALGMPEDGDREGRRAHRAGGAGRQPRPGRRTERCCGWSAQRGAARTTSSQRRLAVTENGDSPS